MVTQVSATFSLGVVGHPRRAELIEQLSEAIDPDVVCIDDTGIGVGANHLRAMKMAYGHAAEHYRTWVVILEDDAVVVDDFRETVGEALRFAPTDMVSFYLGINHPIQFQWNFSNAVKEKVCWIKHPAMRHAVGYAVKADLVGELEAFSRPYIGKNWAPDDVMSQYAAATDRLVSYTNPSIVDHRDLPSVITCRTHMGVPVDKLPLARKAHRFGVPANWDGSFVSVKVP